MLGIDEAGFREPDELLDEVVEALAAVGEEGEEEVAVGVGVGGSESV